MKQGKIIIAGAGSIGTALGNVFAVRPDLDISLLSIEPDVVKSINNNGVNSRYFPGIKLHPRLKAIEEKAEVSEAQAIFFAVPSVAVIEVADDLKDYLHPDALLVNLAKGYGNGSKTVAEILNSSFLNPVASFKGPAFARELLNNSPTGFTVGSSDDDTFDFFKDIAPGTTIHLDFSSDLRGVELISILKNIYAIAMGIVDAHFDSSNLRFMVLTRAFNEIRLLMKILGGQEETMYRYCGIGDFGLTALNDLSRNRTLGLLIGKGFFTESISDKVVLEGKMAIRIIGKEMTDKNESLNKVPIFKELLKIFSEPYNLTLFVNNILKD